MKETDDVTSTYTKPRKSTRAGFRADVETLTELDRIAVDNGMANRSEAIRAAIAAYVASTTRKQVLQT